MTEGAPRAPMVRYALLCAGGAVVAAAATFAWVRLQLREITMDVGTVSARLLDAGGEPLPLALPSLLRLGGARAEATAEVLVANPLPLSGEVIGVTWVMDVDNEAGVARGHYPEPGGPPIPLRASASTPITVTVDIGAGQLAGYIARVLRGEPISWRVSGEAEIEMLGLLASVPWSTETQTFQIE